MEDGLIVFAILGVIISIIVLVIFFKMSANIGKICRIIEQGRIENATILISSAKEENAIGNPQKAKELLLRAKFRIENDATMTEANKSKGISLVDKRLSELIG